MTAIRTILGAALLALVVAPLHAASPWTGQWVWSHQEREVNYFRREFVAPAAPVSAKLAITADNIYELYINGRSIGADSDWTTLEVYDITSDVKPGRNILAVKATDPGPACGGLLVEVGLDLPDGTTSVFGTDDAWRMSAEGPDRWTSLGFDDSQWQSPRLIGKPPVGPWSGIEHTVLVSRAPLEVVAVYWPKKADPGDTLSVTCKVRPLRQAPVESPVGLRILSKGETVFEHWTEPDAPVTQWKTGQVQRVNFDNVRLPSYLPGGVLQAQVVTTGTVSQGSPNIRIGPAMPVTAEPRVAVPRVTVKPAANGTNRVLRVSLDGGSRNASYLLALYSGPRMMFAATVNAGAHDVELPDAFPGGSYSVRLLPHAASWRGEPSIADVRVPGAANDAWKPLGNGRYNDRGGAAHSWYINPQGALIWDGSPYVPVGAMFLSRWFMDFRTSSVEHNEATWHDDLKRLRAMKQAGITDLYLNPCAKWEERPAWVWQRFADVCEELGFNYGLQVTNPLEPLKAWSIAQDEYLVDAVGGETAGVDISGTYNGRTDAANAVLYAAFEADSGALVDWGRAVVHQAAGGIRAEAQPRAPTGARMKVHFIPELTFYGDMHDYWTAVNSDHYARLDRFFGTLDLGPGFRLWIDPLDNEQSFRDMNRMLPHSLGFRSMFADYLRERYATAESAAAAWGIAGANPGFEMLARMVPVGKAVGDTGWAIDETTGRTFEVDLRKSSMWFDMLRFRDSSIADFNCRVADAIKKHHDVPVVLKATDTDCFVNSREVGGFDGLGMEAYGAAPELVRGCGGGVYSRCKQANRTMWNLVTETGLAEEYVGYPSPQRLMTELGSMVEMNAKGTFYFLLSATGGPGGSWYRFNLFEDPRQLQWMGAFSRLMKNAPHLAEYEPEVDWYFPGAMAGQRDGFARSQADFFSDIPSQSVGNAAGRWTVTTSSRIPADARRIIVSLEESPATEIYGQIFEEALESHEVVVIGHRRNRGALSIDGYYTGRFVQLADGSTVQALDPGPTSTVFAHTPDGLVYGLRDGRLTLYSRSGWIGAVREMSANAPSVRSCFDVLGVQPIDIGQAFQLLQAGDTACLWNLTPEDKTLSLSVPSGASATITAADGHPVRCEPGEVDLLLPAAAASAVRVEGLAKLELEGVDRANLAEALRQYTKASELASEAGVDASVTPPTSDWRALYELAEQLRRSAHDAELTTRAPRRDNIRVDGNLDEWAGSDPVYLKMDVGIDYAKAADYDRARFYLAYDDSRMYIAGEVTDEAVVNNYRLGNIWNGDAMEIFIDLFPDELPGVRQYNDNCFQFLFAPANRDGEPEMIVKNNQLPPDTAPGFCAWAPVRTDSGWRFELAIDRRDLNGYAFEAGRAIGFTMQLDDSDGGDRTSAWLWRGSKNASRDRQGLGRLVFGGG